MYLEHVGPALRVEGDTGSTKVLSNLVFDHLTYVLNVMKQSSK